MEGNLRFKIDWASLIVGRKFTVLLCFTLHLKAISKYKSPGGLYLEGPFNGGFFALRVWEAYTWKGLFSEFYGILNIKKKEMCFLLLTNELNQLYKVYLTIKERTETCFKQNSDFFNPRFFQTPPWHF